jgi:hypothetical protein
VPLAPSTVMTSWRGVAWGLLALACGDPIEGEASWAEDAGQTASELSSNGSVTSQFPAVVSISTVCTATKIDAGKFLTAPECAERLTDGSVLRYTNHPLGLDGAPASAIRSGRVKSTSFMASTSDYAQGDLLSVIALHELHTDDYPSMPIASAFFGGDSWFTQVGYGNDALNAADQGKQLAQFDALNRSEWYDRAIPRVGEDAREVWVYYIPARTDDAERPGLDDDIGGPALVQQQGVWRVVGVYRRVNPVRLPSFPDLHYVQRIDGLDRWFQSAGYGELPLPSVATFSHARVGCVLSRHVYGVTVSADRGFRFESEIKEGGQAFRPLRNDDARSFSFTISRAGGPVSFRVRACNVTGCSAWTSSNFTAPACPS